MFYRLNRFAVGIANLILLWLTWKFFRGQLDWGLAVGSLALSGFWLVLTAVRLRELFSTYFDTFSRLRVRLPLITGLLLAAAAFYANQDPWLRVTALGLEVGWLAVYAGYRYNRRSFESKGHGPLPKDAWVNMPWHLIPNGALILMSGRIAKKLRESVGHGEVAVDEVDGTRTAFSSYMEHGVVINSLESMTAARVQYGHYIVLRLATPLDEQQLRDAPRIMHELKAKNEAWRDEKNRQRLALIDKLWLPQSWRAWLAKKTNITGYDWPGLFIGMRSDVRWTCIGACLELYQRLGIKTNQYGTGLLGLGTGLLNPIMPVRFLADKAFVLMTLADKAALEAKSKSA